MSVCTRECFACARLLTNGGLCLNNAKHKDDYSTVLRFVNRVGKIFGVSRETFDLAQNGKKNAKFCNLHREWITATLQVRTNGHRKIV